VAKIASTTWRQAVKPDFAQLDIIHRPYQPGIDVDYRRYHAAGHCVAVTVLDFIAYDNPWYHETERAWQQYRVAFDRNVRLADCVFAISAYIASRIERQFAHELSGSVRSVPLGTDHLRQSSGSQAADLAPAIAALDREPFLLVLGNDFAHKNRDFAVKVFVHMRERGYRGRLVLAGFHLDLGSSYGSELDGADRYVDSVIRMGPVSSAEKTWLMQRADAVLYPTSSEGFGLVPFEAAALGTPTAFVRFGALRETLPAVAACDGWRVAPFAEHVFALISDRARYVEQVRAAGTALTWSAHVDGVLDGYTALMRDGTPWRSRGHQLPGSAHKVQQAVASLGDRLTAKVSRILGLPQR
jgi:glycosyltransferase involved in cell wall biosynthesis